MKAPQLTSLDRQTFEKANDKLFAPKNSLGGALMIPPLFIPRRTGQRAGDLGEDRVYHLLQQLDSSWTVFHSLHLLGVGAENRDPDKLPDIDFFLFHREKGIFLIEVKNNPLVLDEKGRVVNRYKNFETKQTDSKVISMSLEGARYQVNKYLQKKCPGFPWEDVLRTVLIALKNDRQDEAIKQCMQNGRKQDLYLTRQDIGFLSSYLSQSRAEVNGLTLDMCDFLKRDLTECGERSYQNSAMNIIVANDVVNRLEANYWAQAQQFLNGFLEQKKILIEGFAGTGKTQILRYKVHSLLQSKEPPRILVFAWNSLLQAQLEQEIVQSGHSHERVRVVKESNLKNLLRENAEPFDRIFIDEVQDLTKEQWESLKALSHAESSWFCCLDSQQKWIYGENRETEDFLKDFRRLFLHINFRNPKQVHDVGVKNLQKHVAKKESVQRAAEEHLEDYRPHEHLTYREGFAEVSDVAAGALHARLSELIHRLHSIESLLSSSLVVVSNLSEGDLNKSSSDGLYFGLRLRIEGQEYCLLKTGAAKPKDFEGVVIRLETVRRFKGLEAPLIISVFYANEDRFTVNLEQMKYLAATRAQGGYYELNVRPPLALALGTKA